METTPTVKILGRFIVADPKVCHGQPTFRGTRVFVADVLDQVARGLDWETIIEEWHGSITTTRLPKPCTWQHKRS